MGHSLTLRVCGSTWVCGYHHDWWEENLGSPLFRTVAWSLCSKPPSSSQCFNPLGQGNHFWGSRECFFLERYKIRGWGRGTAPKCSECHLQRYSSDLWFRAWTQQCWRASGPIPARLGRPHVRLRASHARHAPQPFGSPQVPVMGDGTIAASAVPQMSATNQQAALVPHHEVLLEEAEGAESSCVL